MAPSRFDLCLKRVLIHEGGNIDDPQDRGGRTSRGITQEVYDNYRVSKGMRQLDVWEATDGDVRDIYFARYWAPLCCALLPVGLDWVTFDAGVNSGTRRAGKWLQRSLGMAEGDIDGVIGQQTLRYVHDAMAADEVDRVIDRFMEARRDFLANIVLRDPSQARFSRGWGNRCSTVELCALEDRGNG